MKIRDLLCERYFKNDIDYIRKRLGSIVAKLQEDIKDELVKTDISDVRTKELKARYEFLTKYAYDICDDILDADGDSIVETLIEITQYLNKKPSFDIQDLRNNICR